MDRRTKNMLKKLIHYSVTTGALTALTSLIVLICYNALPKNILFGGLLEVLSKLYANSSLAMLNARRRVSAGAMGTMTALSVPNPSNANNNNLSIRFGRGRRRMSAIRWAVASETKDMRTFGEETEAEAEVDTFGTAAAQDSADTFGTLALQETQKPVAAHLHEVDVEVGKGAV
ncbi:hypothetical protein BDW22DRAFT_318205 [Trametopsis cervina]|nr:hypothetical protein BDW22DRAFT_318205 [Trametopsis cervina]